MVEISTDVDLAVERLRAGGLVAVPTETVYGLAADARNADAVRRVFAVKQRPVGHPLIVHLARADQLSAWATSLSEHARRYAALAWPGPLSLIVSRAPQVLDVVTGGRDTVALRVPSHPMFHRLLDDFGDGLAAPSANRFGSVSPTTAEHVLADLGDYLDDERDLIVDGGPSSIGLESTIVDTTTQPPQLLRAGPISADQLGALAAATGPSRASGMLTSHYAPRCEVRLVDHRDDADALLAGTIGARILDRSNDVAEYATHLYADLRAADADGVRTLIAVLPPPEGLGLAIRDRLSKAAAPRPGHGQS